MEVALIQRGSREPYGPERFMSTLSEVAKVAMVRRSLVGMASFLRLRNYLLLLTWKYPPSVPINQDPPLSIPSSRPLIGFLGKKH